MSIKNTAKIMANGTSDPNDSQGWDATDTTTLLTLISEVQTGNHAPWIAPGTNGLVTFIVQDYAPGEAGASIHFTAPTGTTLVDASIPGLSASYYTFTRSDDYLTGNLTLKKSIGTWGSCELTLAVDGNTAAGAYLSDGIAQYFTPNGQQMGDAAAISVITATITITEELHDQHIPWIFPGTSGTVTFSVVADAPDGTGSYLYFTAPTYTDPATHVISHNATITGVTFSDPALKGKCTFTSENNGLNARLTLITDDVLWSDCIVTLAVDSSMPKFATLNNGKVQYFSSDSQQVGDAAPVTVIAASSNHWDNVASVKSCFIGMQSDDTSRTNKGTLFMNGENGENNTFSAHSIPVFVGITFKRFSDDFDGPTEDEVRTAISLVGLASDGQTIINISDDFSLTNNMDYRNAYYKTTVSSSDFESPLENGAYEYELNLGAWCPKYYNDILPGNIIVYLHLEAQLSAGIYKYTSNGETPANLTINFLARKKYQYSENPGNSSYVLVKKETASNSLSFTDGGEVRKVGSTHEKSIYRVVIDSTPEQLKYVFKFKKLIWLRFSSPSPSDNYSKYGDAIHSVYIKGMSISGKAQWTNYGQHMLLPDYNFSGYQDLMSSRFINSSYYIGMVGTHEAHGWACAGTLNVTGNGITINPGEIAFAALSIDFESSSEGVVWDANNHKDSSGNSPICLVDNFGNHVYMVPNFNASTDSNGSTSMSVTVEDK
ncbi:hypothetical protein [Salmonella enterica]|uniref:Uncharacterized protein n=1 Tax=Salmonella enterica subsp. indica serovar 6,14,25:z10:1,(2),7 str. 1121 TaxID=1173950 RepID=V1HUP0_SALER|nr:hypothetical protein [Salmonella enterica]ESE86384.1 hypothetical protein SEI61121_06436 [Salmonella enterica subsp. indica serovar 6,14,25:z10:1,(2),7 str. 1121]